MLTLILVVLAVSGWVVALGGRGSGQPAKVTPALNPSPTPYRTAASSIVVPEKVAPPPLPPEVINYSCYTPTGYVEGSNVIFLCPKCKVRSYIEHYPKILPGPYCRCEQYKEEGHFHPKCPQCGCNPVMRSADSSSKA